MDDQMPDTPDDVTPTEVELARLADGTLPTGEREAARARAQSSPELQAALDEERRAVSLMRASDEVVAPASLRAAVDGLTETAAGDSRRRDPSGMRLGLPRWRRSLFLPGATALAVIVAGIVIALSGSSHATVRQTARVALASATSPAPAEDPTDHDRLALRAAGTGGVAFPSYLHDTGWEASGARRDTLHGRQVTTVYYRAGDGTRVGYAIVSGKALDSPDGPTRSVRGVRYTFARLGSARLVTWWRDGHTCVIAGTAVSDRTLLALATADGRASS